MRDLGATVRIEVRHPDLAPPLIAIQERGRFAGNALEAGLPVAIAARRWVIFGADH
jgi:hypothetical protein